MNLKKILVAVMLLIISIIIIYSFIPIPQSYVKITDKCTFNLVPCDYDNLKLSTWEGKQYYTKNEPPKIYLDELKKKFLESGFSESYFNNIKLIYASLDSEKKEINIWYRWNTGTWLDCYEGSGGSCTLDCNCPESCDLCKFYLNRVRGWVNLEPYGRNESIVYEIQGKIWHDNKVVGDNTRFTEIRNVLSPWEAGILAKSCVPFSLNKFSVYLSDMKFEYVVNGENLQTLFDYQLEMQARVDLVSRSVECITQPSFVT
jgi:hypothetical protein